MLYGGSVHFSKDYIIENNNKCYGYVYHGDYWSLERLGFSLAEVKTLFDMYDTNPNSAVQLEAMLDMTEQKRAVLKQQLEDIQMLMTELDDVEARCREELAELKRGKIA